MPLVQTRGAASAQGFGEFAQVTAVNYIEEVFSTYLYTGTGAAQTITNGIDLATEGGMVWTKSRSATGEHNLVCNDVGLGKWIKSNSTAASQSFAPNGYAVPVFNTTGVTLSDSADQATNAVTYTSWTFRKQPKFFDVVTYTGTGSNRTVAHNLGSVPGCIIVKDTSAVSNWYVYHRSLATNQALKLNSTAAIETSATFWNNTAATSTNFSLGTAGDVNGNGDSFVAYIFAHDAGGFGLAGTDNVISCGSYVGNGLADGPTVTLGYEPQWLLLKSAGGTDGWQMVDTMRGWTVNPGVASSTKPLFPNTDAAEGGISGTFTPTATGFKVNSIGGLQNDNGITYIYIAIRRGPMKVPTSGTSVFAPILATASTGTSRTVGFPADMTISRIPSLANGNQIADRLRGYANTSAATPLTLATNSASAESAVDNFVYNVWNTTALDGPYATTYSNLWLHFRRAPSFFDEVCYTGNTTSGTAGSQTINHNLGVAPEFGIFKGRNTTSVWVVMFPDTSGDLAWANLNSTDASVVIGVPASAFLGNATTFTARTNANAGNANSQNNISGTNYVAYLFATCAGVSKCGRYTGNAGNTVTVPCGFTGGVRFVLIKRTDSTGDWYVWDSARGIIAGNDPYLLLNDTAAEVTGTDYVDTYSAGFEVTSTAPAALNATGGSYIFLAIA